MGVWVGVGWGWGSSEGWVSGGGWVWVVVRWVAIYLKSNYVPKTLLFSKI